MTQIPDKLATADIQLLLSRQQGLLWLVQQLPDMAWLKDATGRYLACNRRFEAFAGVSRQAIIGQSDTMVLGPQQAAALSQADIAALAAEEPLSSQQWLVSAEDGQRILLEIVTTPLQAEDGVFGVLGTARDITRQYLSDLALRASQDRFRAIFENTDALAIQGYAPDGTVLYWNHASEALYGYSAAEALGRTLFELIIPPPARAHVEAEVAWMFRERRGVPAARLGLQHKDGHIVQVYSSHAMVESPQSGLTLFCLDIDLTALVRAEAAWRDSERRYRVLFDASGDGIFVLHGQIIVDCNQAAAEIFHCEQADLTGMSLEVLSPLRQDGGVSSRQLLGSYLHPDNDSPARRFEWRHLRRDGSEFDAEWIVTAVEIAAVPHCLVSFRDITEKKKSAQLIWEQANFDSLTGLPNRHRFLDRFALELRKSERSNGQLALLFIDLDHFKEVNDTLGHRAGDLLLKEAALRLLGCLRETDTVARLGGDEFTIVISDMDSEQSLERVTQQVLQRLAAPFCLGDEQVYVSASIGITLFPQDGDNIDALQRNADQAMYAAKKAGRNGYCYYAAMPRASLA